MRFGGPLVSVILASYNHERFVAEAAQSVLNQTCADLELIVVDDGSSDATADVVASLRDTRLTLVRLSENRAQHPRNLALSRARGRYIAFQNSDDVWFADKLAAQLQVMQANRRCAACFTEAAIIDARGMVSEGTWADGLFLAANRTAVEWLRHFFDVGNCLPLPSAMVRRSDLVRIGGFRPSLVQLSDLDVWIQLAARGDFHILPEQLVKVRVLDDANLSAPTLRAQRRSMIERSLVLMRYTEPPLIQRFDQIFPDLSRYASVGSRKVALALRAWRTSGVWSHFSDEVLGNVVDNSRERADAISDHGMEFVRLFFDRRCESAYVWQGTQ
jgi:glycosyltransferase involved in cell wall biosynthesis